MTQTMTFTVIDGEVEFKSTNMNKAEVIGHLQMQLSIQLSNIKFAENTKNDSEKTHP